MSKKIEIIFDNNPSEGCGCNCGCGGSSKVDAMNELIDNLKEYQFNSDVTIDTFPVSEVEINILINKINTLLDNTSAVFRLDEDNVDAALSELLPLVVLDGEIITAYGVPPFSDVVGKVNSSL